MTDPQDLPDPDDDGRDYQIDDTFLSVTSENGGPYDTGAFIAGMQLGAAVEHLRVMNGIGVTESEPLLINNELRDQVDLFAMKYGYRVLVNRDSENCEYDCMFIRFKRPDPPADQ